MKEGWKIQTLGDIATFINGDRSTNYPSKKDYVIDGVPFVNAGNLISAGLDFASLNLISHSKYDSLTQGKFVEGDILFCLRGTLGKHSIVQKGLKGAIASSLVIIRAKNGFCNKYISYYLDYKQPFIESLNNGAAQPNIPAKTMKEFSILIPTNEQRQQSIVDYLDSAFAKIDAMKANAEKQLSEAKALFQKALEEAMKPKEGWEEKTLGEICRIERGGSPRPIKQYITTEENGLNWIKIGDTDPLGKYIYDTKEKIKPEGLKKSRWVEEDDFLLSNSMSYGRPYILKTNGCIHDGWLVLRDYQKELYIDFFYYLLISSKVQSQFKQKAQGSTVSNLNTDRVASTIVSYPPLSEQQAIVSQLDQLSEKVKRLQEIQEKTIKECDALKQAILREVFE